MMLDKLLNEYLTEFGNDLRVCMPAKITEYDPGTQIAQVQPLIKRTLYRRSSSELLPIINDVLVVHSRTDKAMIRFPVNKGDIVTLVFADRSLENWLKGDGTEKDPNDTRSHSLNDAYAFLGGYPEGKKWTPKNKDALEIIVKAGTKITVGNESEELLQLASDAFNSLKDLTEELSQAMTDIQSITVTGNSGSPTSTPINASSFATLKTNIDAITNTVNTTITDLAKIKV